jgi:hypothetical protein
VKKLRRAQSGLGGVGCSVARNENTNQPLSHEQQRRVEEWMWESGFLVFFDNEPKSETYGQQIESCPTCGG